MQQIDVDNPKNLPERKEILIDKGDQGTPWKHEIMTVQLTAGETYYRVCIQVFFVHYFMWELYLYFQLVRPVN